MKNNFVIGEQIKYDGRICTILGFTDNRQGAVIQLPQDTPYGHSGTNKDYWFDEKGKALTITCDSKRYYVLLEDVKKVLPSKVIYKFLM